MNLYAQVVVLRRLRAILYSQLFSLARATPVWKNRGLVTALHTTSSDGMQLADMVGRAAVAQLTQV